jgi:hypothetical protein
MTQFIVCTICFVAGGIVGAGGWAAFQAKVKSDASALLASAKAEVTKTAPSLAAVGAWIDAAIAKL